MTIPLPKNYLKTFSPLLEPLKLNCIRMVDFVNYRTLPRIPGILVRINRLVCGHWIKYLSLEVLVGILYCFSFFPRPALNLLVTAVTQVSHDYD